MLRWLCVGSLFLSAGVLGCGGDPVMFEPGPTCTAFCALAVGECGVTQLGDDVACTQNCELERSFADQTSEACLVAFEAAVDCAAALDCQDIIDRVNQVNVDSYPCLAELDNSDLVCGQG